MPYNAQMLGVRRAADPSKLADDGGQILKFHLETYHLDYAAICRLFTWKQPNAPVQRSGLMQVRVQGKDWSVPNLAGSAAAIAGRKQLERTGVLSSMRRIYLDGQAASAEGPSEAVGLHGILLPISEMMQVLEREGGVSVDGGAGGEGEGGAGLRGGVTRAGASELGRARSEP